ncbi:MAG TPA: ubiquitin-like protein UBact [Fimbriimonadaceae bacterium]|nr:ubiquitin-like protein UBact [Fimbriimonadaceae bacterium]HRJ33860.1 ubiquitin-like protein UBact [Fimbriimonadaceae bacterium]
MITADRTTRRLTEEPERKHADEDGPQKPDLKKPAGPNELLKRMKNVDPDQAKKYRQRSGQ